MPPKKKQTPSNQMINFYEKMPKKFLTKPDNPNYDLHQINNPFTMCVSAPTGSGKTTFTTNLIHRFSSGKDGTFQKIYVICSNKNEPLYEYLQTLSDRIFVKEGIESIPDLDKEFGDQKKDNTSSLVVFDDLVLKKNQRPIESYYMKCRKWNVSVMYLSQSYFQIPIFIRRNSMYCVFLKMGGSRTIKQVLTDFSLGISQEQLYNMYEYATSEKFGCFLIDLVDDSKKYRKGFLEILDPSKFTS